MRTIQGLITQHSTCPAVFCFKCFSLKFKIVMVAPKLTINVTGDRSKHSLTLTSDILLIGFSVNRNLCYNLSRSALYRGKYD